MKVSRTETGSRKAVGFPSLDIVRTGWDENPEQKDLIQPALGWAVWTRDLQRTFQPELFESATYHTCADSVAGINDGIYPAKGKRNGCVDGQVHADENQ